jgi:hypothetical protein
LRFFPDNRRLLASADRPSTFAVYDVPSLRPRAFIKSQVELREVFPSPDNHHLAAYDINDHLHLFRQTAHECPESIFGLLGMPHVWLFLALLLATTLSLQSDARRRAGAPRSLLAIVLLLAALPRTAQLILTACLAQPLLTPAPLLLLAAIALASNARFWRITTQFLLAAAMSINIICLFRLKQSGLTTTTSFDLMDRTHTVPNLALFIILAATTAALALVFTLLARSPAAFDI